MARLLIGYDVADPRRRRRILRTLRIITGCYQESFFDCELQRQELPSLFAALTDILDPSADSLILATTLPQHALYNRPRWYGNEARLHLIV